MALLEARRGHGKRTRKTTFPRLEFFLSPQIACLFPIFLSHNGGCSNDTAEDEAVIVGFELTLQILVSSLIIYGFS